MKRLGWQLAVAAAAVACAAAFALPSGHHEAPAAAQATDAVALHAELRDELLALQEQTDPATALTRLDALIRERPGVAGICHVLGHELGRAAVREDGGFARAMAHRVDVCGGGYVHGAVEERLAAEKNPRKAMLTVCGPSSDGTCVHGLGHGAMLLTGNDLPAALTMCQGMGREAERLQCSDGVFMQHFQTDLQGPHPNRFLDPDDPTRVCRDQRGQYRASCYEYAPLYRLTQKAALEHPAAAARSAPEAR